MVKKPLWWIVIGSTIFLLLIFGLAPFVAQAKEPSERVFNVTASLFAWDPNIITVNKGDKVVLHLTSVDVVHGMYIDGYGIDVKVMPGKVTDVEFVADKPGKWRFRCSVTCGNMHPFMIGEMIVEPNYQYWGSLALTFLAAAGTLAFVWTRKETKVK